VAQEIKDRGIVIGPADSYLSAEGRKALVEASASVLKLSESSEVQQILKSGQEAKGKDYIIRVMSKDLECGSDNPLLKVALVARNRCRLPRIVAAPARHRCLPEFPH
jgi:hypothetical protein